MYSIPILPGKISLDEINQQVIVIRKRISREKRFVNYVNVTSELCNYYKVPSVCQLNLNCGKRLMKETDIQQILDIVRLQAKVREKLYIFAKFIHLYLLILIEVCFC